MVTRRALRPGYNHPIHLQRSGLVQKSKARRKAAKVRRKRVQNTHFKTRRVSSKERYK